MSSLSPLDGRYATYVSEITVICSERGFMRARIEVECKYLESLVRTLQSYNLLEYREALMIDSNIWKSEELIDMIFDIEKETAHDVKAVELGLRKYLNLPSSI